MKNSVHTKMGNRPAAPHDMILVGTLRYLKNQPYLAGGISSLSLAMRS